MFDQNPIHCSSVDQYEVLFEIRTCVTVLLFKETAVCFKWNPIWWHVHALRLQCLPSQWLCCCLYCSTCTTGPSVLRSNTQLRYEGNLHHHHQHHHPSLLLITSCSISVYLPSSLSNPSILFFHRWIHSDFFVSVPNAYNNVNLSLFFLALKKMKDCELPWQPAHGGNRDSSPRLKEHRE